MFLLPVKLKMTMPDALAYFLRRVFYYFTSFPRHWYVNGVRNLMRFSRRLFASLERAFEARSILSRFFTFASSLTFFDRLHVFAFRAIRLIVGSVVYACAGMAIAVIALVWFSIPVVLIVYVII
jgi:hypothetical protein